MITCMLEASANSELQGTNQQQPSDPGSKTCSRFDLELLPTAQSWSITGDQEPCNVSTAKLQRHRLRTDKAYAREGRPGTSWGMAELLICQATRWEGWGRVAWGGGVEGVKRYASFFVGYLSRDTLMTTQNTGNASPQTSNVNGRDSSPCKWYPHRKLPGLMQAYIYAGLTLGERQGLSLQSQTEQDTEELGKLLSVLNKGVLKVSDALRSLFVF